MTSGVQTLNVVEKDATYILPPPFERLSIYYIQTVVYNLENYTKSRIETDGNREIFISLLQTGARVCIQLCF